MPASTTRRNGRQPDRRAINDDDIPRAADSADGGEWFANGEIGETVAIEIALRNAAAAAGRRTVFLDADSVPRRIRQVIARIVMLDTPLPGSSRLRRRRAGC